MDSVKNRTLDAMTDIKPTVEREPYFNFTEPYLKVLRRVKDKLPGFIDAALVGQDWQQASAHECEILRGEVQHLQRALAQLPA